MENLIDGEDFAFMAEAMQEVAGLTDRLVQVKRNTGFTGGTLDGVDPSPVYQLIDVMATIESVSDQEIMQSGGFLTVGDMKFSAPIELYEKTETPQQGDVLLFEDFDWYMVGKVSRETVGGIVYSRATFRRT